jgi:hypothetical protein
MTRATGVEAPGADVWAAAGELITVAASIGKASRIFISINFPLRRSARNIELHHGCVDSATLVLQSTQTARPHLLALRYRH